MVKTTEDRPKPGEFFILEPDARRGGPGHGVVFENRKALITPPRLILRPEEGASRRFKRFRAWYTTPKRVLCPKT